MVRELGRNRYELVPSNREGWLQAEYVLPACPSGGRRWYGILSFSVAGVEHQARYRFDLAPRAD